MPSAWRYVLQQNPQLHSLCNDGRVSGQRRPPACKINLLRAACNHSPETNVVKRPLSWTLRILSGISEGVCEWMV